MFARLDLGKGWFTCDGSKDTTTQLGSFRSFRGRHACEGRRDNWRRSPCFRRWLKRRKKARRSKMEWCKTRDGTWERRKTRRPRDDGPAEYDERQVGGNEGGNEGGIYYDCREDRIPGFPGSLGSRANLLGTIPFSPPPRPHCCRWPIFCRESSVRDGPSPLCRPLSR